MSGFRYFFLILFMSFLVISSVCRAEQLFPEAVVSTAWVAEHYLAPGYVIIDLRDQVSEYWEGHLPGARYLNPETLRTSQHGVPVVLLPAKALAFLLGEMGIDAKTHIIIYGEKNSPKAAYLLWALDYYGHNKASVMDGGFTKWLNEGRRTTREYPTVTPVLYRWGKKNTDARVFLTDVKGYVEHANTEVTIVDARDKPLCACQGNTWDRIGIIPGAHLHEWSRDLQSDGTLKSIDDLRYSYQIDGILPDKKIVVYCTQGYCASHVYLVLHYLLDYPNVSCYDTGYQEWQSHEDLPLQLEAK